MLSGAITISPEHSTAVQKRITFKLKMTEMLIDKLCMLLNGLFIIITIIIMCNIESESVVNVLFA